MVEFTKEELLNLARISSLKLYDHEIEHLREQLQKTLDYTEELEQLMLKAATLKQQQHRLDEAGVPDKRQMWQIGG